MAKTGCLAAGVLSALTLLCTPALAKEPGVTTDPQGPAQKEYALPLDSARNNANGGGHHAAGGGGSGGGGGGGSGTSSGLFGAGVAPQHGSHPHGGNHSKKSGGSTATGSRAPTRGIAHPVPPVAHNSSPSEAARNASVDGGGSTATILGVVAGVMILGLGSAFVMRRFGGLRSG
jgi:hypothetical protein